MKKMNSQIEEIFNAAVTLEQKKLEETKLKQVINYHCKNKKWENLFAMHLLTSIAHTHTVFPIIKL